MKRSTYSEQQIVKILKEAEAGISVEELSRQYGFGISTYYKMESLSRRWHESVWLSVQGQKTR